jgi:hypothetical protein
MKHQSKTTETGTLPIIPQLASSFSHCKRQTGMPQSHPANKRLPRRCAPRNDSSLNTFVKKGAALFSLLIASALVILMILSPSAFGQGAVFKLKVVTEMANIRLKPDIGSIIIQQVPEGTIFESTKKEGEWFSIKIMTDEGETVSGYIHESMVIVLEGPPQVEEKPEVVKPPEKEIKKIPEVKKGKEQEPVPQPAPQKEKAAPQPSKFLFEICFSGGGSYVEGGDLNEGAKGVVDYKSDELEIQGEGKFEPTNLCYLYGGELAFSLSKRLLLGFGADYLQGEKESKVLFEDSVDETVTVRPKIQALPLRLFFSYHLASNFYLKSGIEYYFVRCTYFYQFKNGQQLEQRGEADSQGFGFVGGLGLERAITSGIIFFLEATGRYAKISRFKGKHAQTDPAGEETGKLYYFQRSEIPAGDPHPQLYVRSVRPDEAGESGARDAIIDLSGMSLKTGFKIRF